MRVWWLMMIGVGFICLNGFTQLPQEDRLTDWSVAGLSASLPLYTQLTFPGNADGITNYSPLLQSILDSLSKPTILLFGEGIFLFKKGIRLPSNVVIRGLGSEKTHFIFDQGNRHEASFLAKGNEPTRTFPIEKSIAKGDKYFDIIEASGAALQPGDMIRLIQNDSALVNNSWALGSIGQILNIIKISMPNVETRSPFRLAFKKTGQLGFRKIIPIEYTGIEYLKITRNDYTNTGGGSSNIVFRYARNCWVKAIESEQCNFAHIEVNNSTNLLIEKSYFHHALNYGGNGRAYGVMLQYTTGEILVQNNIFSNLRHSMILQAGANGNVFSYNYSFDGKKEIFPGFFVAGEDMVLHGNYPFSNLFESNIAQFASIDNSHGKNGPFNTYFRNMVTLVGFSISNPSSDAQNIIANHRVSGFISIMAIDHRITDNSWQEPSNLSQNSLIYKEIPAFLSGNQFGKIGPPLFDTSKSIPAKTRVLTLRYTDIGDVIQWKGNKWGDILEPSKHTNNYTLEVFPGKQVILNDGVQLKAIQMKPGSEARIIPNGRIIIGMVKGQN